MTRKQKIDLIRVGVKPEKKIRYRLTAIQKDNDTFNVTGEDLFKNVCIKGVYTKKQLNDMSNANGGFNSIHAITFVDFGAKNAKICY
jgi:hypothetical protein